MFQDNLTQRVHDMAKLAIEIHLDKTHPGYKVLHEEVGTSVNIFDAHGNWLGVILIAADANNIAYHKNGGVKVFESSQLPEAINWLVHIGI